MLTIAIALGSFAVFFLAYRVYGGWIGCQAFQLDPNAEAPSHALQDDVDFVPTRRSVVFGHHFTSIAGTGPIVGPAIAVFWGWLPALLWVVLGSIFVGAVHDFGALVVSLRNRGQTVGEVAGRLISPRARILFLLVLFFALTIVLAIFGLVIAQIFSLYPETVLSVWVAMPLAVVVGLWGRHRGGKMLAPSLVALVLLYVAVYVGAYHAPLALPASWSAGLAAMLGISPEWTNPVVLWTVALFVYCFAASVLPVWLLLQPRDYINSQQLFVALGLLIGGVLVAGLTGKADLASAPAVTPLAERPTDAPPLWPFLFITIACGAVSGFHCLVSSGTSSKQLANEADSQLIGYGAMLMEGALAVLVILACCAGVAMGSLDRRPVGEQTGWLRPYQYTETLTEEGRPLIGAEVWRSRYDTTAGWNSFKLSHMVGAFVDGGANFIATLGIAPRMSVAVIAVLVACFAATTLDTATRLQRYVVQELAGALHFSVFKNKYTATSLAVGLGLAIAMTRGPAGPGSGGFRLWPLFGATNQLLAGLAFLVIAFYLWRRGRPIWFLVPPMSLMILLPAWALLWQMLHPDSGWLAKGDMMLVGIGVATLGLQAWIVVEAMLVFPHVRGVLEEALPPLEPKPKLAGGRSC